MKSGAGFRYVAISDFNIATLNRLMVNDKAWPALHAV